MITAACRTKDGLEWTTIKVKQDGSEPPLQHRESVPLPETLAEHLKGDITVALPTSELLMRTMEFPTTDPAEIADMVGFQVDKISPFPADQLDIAHEVLQLSDETATVLMTAAKRECIDAIGDEFLQHDVHIHSIDARILGWLRLMRDQETLAENDCEILVVDDGIDFSILVMAAGIPIACRALHIQLDAESAIDELIHEIGYTLTTLDAEHDLPEPSAIRFWSIHEILAPLCAELAKKSGVAASHHDLNTLPPLSEGIIRRTLDGESRIELIPREWIEFKQRKQLIKKFTIIPSGIAAVWIFVLLVFFGIFKARDLKLAGVQERANAIAPAAREAIQNQNKLKKLKAYTDRSDSALECLREVTRILPAGDIEFGSYSYTKGKGVTLRGTANNDDLVNDFFVKLTTSPLFDRLKDQSVNTTTTKGIPRAVFSVTLALPTGEDEE